MNDNIKKYIKEINGYKNDMLESYKNLVVDYEESRETYEEIIAELKPPIVSSTILQCSQVVGYNNAPIGVQWAVELLDGSQIYESGKLNEYEQFVLDLSTLKLSSGTQFKFRTSFGSARYNAYTDQILEYKENSSVVYYEYPTKDSTVLTYRGIVNSGLTPPMLICSSLSAYNSALVVTKYEIRLADGSGTIYNSGKYKLTETWTKSLIDLDIPPGTLLKLHAGVVSGDDSEPYVILEYDPYASTATFTLCGNAFRTEMMFCGTR